jgi:hypothetical protein
MRRLLTIVGLVATLGASHVARADDDDWDDEDRGSQQTEQVNPEVFQQQLQPYGQWEADGAYGQVFYPEVAAGWRPYTYGHWAWTEAGWLWASDEPFGWATFHYGRWWFNPYRHHWGWVPGYEWAPAWVTFRFGGASIGWAPLYVGYDGWVDNYPVYYDHWNFVPCEHFYGGAVYSYVYDPSYVRTVFYSTQVSTGYVGTTSYGPPTTYVAAHSAVPITTTPMVHAASPAAAGQATSTSLYNPTRPSSAALRGAGAASTPVVAPPSVRGAFNTGTFASRSPQVLGTAQGGTRPNAPAFNGSNGSAQSRPGAPTFNNGAVQRPAMPQGGNFNRPSAPSSGGGFNNGQRPNAPAMPQGGSYNRPSFPGSSTPSPSRPQNQPTTPPNNYRPSMPAPVQQPQRPRFNAQPHAMNQSAPSFSPPAMARPSPGFAASRPSFGGGGARPSFSAPAHTQAPSFTGPVKRR